VEGDQRAQTAVTPPADPEFDLLGVRIHARPQPDRTVVQQLERDRFVLQLPVRAKIGVATLSRRGPGDEDACVPALRSPADRDLGRQRIILLGSWS
jgi:hypothetical protein